MLHKSPAAFLAPAASSPASPKTAVEAWPGPCLLLPSQGRCWLSSTPVPERSFSSSPSAQIISPACLCDPSPQITGNCASLEEKHVASVHHDAVLHCSQFHADMQFSNYTIRKGFLEILTNIVKPC